MHEVETAKQYVCTESNVCSGNNMSQPLQTLSMDHQSLQGFLLQPTLSSIPAFVHFDARILSTLCGRASGECGTVSWTGLHALVVICDSGLGFSGQASRSVLLFGRVSKSCCTVVFFQPGFK